MVQSQKRNLGVIFLFVKRSLTLCITTFQLEVGEGLAIEAPGLLKMVDSFNVSMLLSCHSCQSRTLSFPPSEVDRDIE